MGSSARRADTRFVIDSSVVSPIASCIPRKNPRKGRPGPISRIRSASMSHKVRMLSTQRTVPEICSVSRLMRPSAVPSCSDPVVLDTTYAECSGDQSAAASYNSDRNPGSMGFIRLL